MTKCIFSKKWRGESVAMTIMDTGYGLWQRRGAASFVLGVRLVINHYLIPRYGHAATSRARTEITIATSAYLAERSAARVLLTASTSGLIASLARRRRSSRHSQSRIVHLLRRSVQSPRSRRALIFAATRSMCTHCMPYAGSCGVRNVSANLSTSPKVFMRMYVAVKAGIVA